MFILTHINSLNKNYIKRFLLLKSVKIRYKVVSNSINLNPCYIEETTIIEYEAYIKARPPPPPKNNDWLCTHIAKNIFIITNKYRR